jgi:hypothetical protein
MMHLGLPSFYITINPADVFNPIVKFLAGADIDIDHLLPEQVPQYKEQCLLIARNPAVAAEFFNIYLKTFISTLLAYDPKQKNLEGGVLGVVKGYYGCVEAQGRGSLHCHMLVWVEGALNPNQIRDRARKDPDFTQRLLRFLDDTISNSVPSQPDVEMSLPIFEHHPCTVRGVNYGEVPEEMLDRLRQQDMARLAEQCQRHSHTGTCYTHWKGPPEPKECRFDLDESNIRPESSFNAETGELCLRCLDGLVNNFNSTMLEAIRCNMDIKFVGSGPSAKAILYYITDYITKSQLKTHVAYAALELAVKKLGEYNPKEDEKTTRAKRLLQKCAHAMISHQELSAQQVCMYLLGHEDHFTSHSFRPLYWTALETFLDRLSPSPECYQNDSTDDKPRAEVPTENGEDGDRRDIDTDNVDGDDAEQEDDPIADDEVIVTANGDGQLIPSANQVCDYVFRGQALKDVCVWDFFAQTEKVTKASIAPRTKQRDNTGTRESEDAPVLHETDTELDDDDDDDQESIEETENILERDTWKRPTCLFTPDHASGNREDPGITRRS